MSVPTINTISHPPLTNAIKDNTEQKSTDQKVVNIREKTSFFEETILPLSVACSMGVWTSLFGVTATKTPVTVAAGFAVAAYAHSYFSNTGEEVNDREASQANNPTDPASENSKDRKVDELTFSDVFSKATKLAITILPYLIAYHAGSIPLVLAESEPLRNAVGEVLTTSYGALKLPVSFAIQAADVSGAVGRSVGGFVGECLGQLAVGVITGKVIRSVYDTLFAETPKEEQKA